MPQRPEALLFDLGGVLIDIDFGRAISSWSRFSSLPVQALRQRFQFDAQYETHERGEMPSAQYFKHIADSLELSATLAQVEEGWNAIFVGEIAPARVPVTATPWCSVMRAWRGTGADVVVLESRSKSHRGLHRAAGPSVGQSAIRLPARRN